MINLIPGPEKEAILYARRNTLLLKWALAIVTVIIGVAALYGAGYLYITSSINRYETQIAQAKTSLQDQELEETKSRIQELSNNMKLIVQVLSRQVLFSELLRQAGAVMPDGSVLSSLDISEVKGGIDLNVQAVDYKTATQVQVNLADPENKLFEKVDIVSIQCGGSSEASNSDSAFDCNATLRALFADDTPFLFINKSQGANKNE